MSAEHVEVMPTLKLSQVKSIYQALVNRLRSSTSTIDLRDKELISRVLKDQLVDDEYPLGETVAALLKHQTCPETGLVVPLSHIETVLRGVVGSNDLARLPDVLRLGAENIVPVARSPKTVRLHSQEIDADGFVISNGKRDHDSQHNWIVAANCYGVSVSRNTFAGVEVITIDGKTEELHDHHVNQLRFDFESRFGFRPPHVDFFKFLETEAKRNSFHPLKDYFSSLRLPDVSNYFASDYTGERLCEEWLIRYGGAEDTPLIRAWSRITLVAAVRRVTQPGCKFDQMLVLETVGPEAQGRGKSTSIEEGLCPHRDYFSDEWDPTWAARERIENAEGIWIFESAELKNISKGEQGAVKANISRRKDKARKAYDRKNTKEERQYIVIGTVDTDHYLTDDAGDRRYWPVRVQEMDVAGIAAIRDRLWAEAVALEASGMSIVLARDLWAAARTEQNKRKIRGRIEDALEVFRDFEGSIRVTDVEEYVARRLGRNNGLTDADDKKIKTCLKGMGLRNRRPDGGTEKQWFPGAGAKPCWTRGDAKKKQKWTLSADKQSIAKIEPSAEPESES